MDLRFLTSPGRRPGAARQPWCWALLLAVLCGMGPAWAEKADRNKPMNIEADALRHDDLKQTSVFTGRVVMTKGSIVLRGARLEVRQDAEGYQFGTVTAEAGRRASFRQRRAVAPAAAEQLMEGAGELIEHTRELDRVVVRVRYGYRGDLPPGATAVVDPSRLTWVQVTELDLVQRRAIVVLQPDH